MKREQKQKNRIVAHLRRYGSINPIQAWERCGVYRLGAVIWNLRKKDGWEIETVDTPVKNRFGEKCEIATYVWKDWNQNEEAKQSSQARATGEVPLR